MPIVYNQHIEDYFNKYNTFSIVSLVPSVTELLYDLGLESEVIAITKFCILPQSWFKTKTRIGGTKTIDTQKINSLKPTFVLANIEENIKEQLEQIDPNIIVWVCNIKTLHDALDMILWLSKLTNTSALGSLMVADIKLRFNLLAKKIQVKRTAAYLIWQKPYMLAAGDTFISNMMEHSGFTNVLAHECRYPEKSLDEIKTINPEVILLSSEPFPFKKKQHEFFVHEFPNSKVMLVDGAMYSWYGSRLLLAPQYFESLIFNS